MEFNTLIRKLQKYKISSLDIALYLGLDDISKHTLEDIELILKELEIEEDFSFDKNKKIIEIFEEEVKIKFFSTLMERTLSSENKKNTGSYYTIPEVVKHMTNQTLKLSLFKHLGEKEILKIYNLNSKEDFFSPQVKFYQFINHDKLSFNIAENIFGYLTNIKILEPSSGAGVFIFYIIDYLNFVLNSLSKQYKFNYSVIDIIKNIHANDCNHKTLNLSKFIAIHFLNIEGKKAIKKGIKIINDNWTKFDFLEYKDKIKFDIIIGNPPYLEVKNNEFLGNESNLYSYFVRKSFEISNENSVISFIIPNSFQTTKKYKDLRNFVLDKSDYLFLESYNDRPSSLFAGVHQRLNIFFSTRGSESNIFTTEHIFHRKKEVKKMFDNISYYANNSFYKLGNKLDESILSKIRKVKNPIDILKLESDKGRELLISSRLGLWPKSFIDDYQSKEVMRFKVNEKYINILNAIFNSTTFYSFWIMTSDAWHVTKGNLMEFKFNDEILSNKTLDKLGLKLSGELEKSKVFVNTSQVKYEYKHKLHKDLIDEIDIELSKVYGFTKKETKRILNYAIDYRMAKWK